MDEWVKVEMPRGREVGLRFAAARYYALALPESHLIDYKW
jgi:hypothetical protein